MGLWDAREEGGLGHKQLLSVTLEQKIFNLCDMSLNLCIMNGQIPAFCRHCTKCLPCILIYPFYNNPVRNIPAKTSI